MNSDFEINTKIAILRNKVYHIIQSGDNKTGAVNIVTENGNVRPYNPCNDPSDAWPIMLDNNITVINNKDDDDDYQAMILDGWFDAAFIESMKEVHASYAYSAFDEKPFRAAMLCFLKSKGVIEDDDD